MKHRTYSDVSPSQSSVSVDDGTGEQIIKQGVLRKRMNYVRVYQKYYVVVRHSRVDIYREKTRELHSSFVLDSNFHVSQLSASHRHYMASSKDQQLVFGIYNRDYLCGRFMASSEKSAQEWHAAFKCAINGHKPQQIDTKASSDVAMNMGRVDYCIDCSKISSKIGFEFIDTIQGMNIYKDTNAQNSNLLLKTGCSVNVSADVLFDIILNDGAGDYIGELRERTEILEEDVTLGTRIEHRRCFPINVLGLWTKPRDFVLQRSWQRVGNGCFVVTYRSVTHPKAPVSNYYIRGKIWLLGFMILPQKIDGQSHSSKTDTPGACWVDMCMHFDPLGWLSQMPLWTHRLWAYSLMDRFFRLMHEEIQRIGFQSIGYRSAFHKSRKLEAEAHPMIKGALKLMAKSSEDSNFFETQSDPDEFSVSRNAKKFRGSLEGWEQVPLESEPFMVRGKNYLSDKVKIPCRKSVFSLVACDLFETSDQITHIASRSDNLVHQLTTTGKHPFIFMVHFSLPGPPFYSLVCYFAAADHEVAAIGTPFGDLLSEFLNSASDSDFRDATFKLIPRVVSGSWVVKKAVGTTPAIIGKKMAIRYFGDGETYFEVNIDISSSAIAGSILSVVKGYAVNLTIDLAFLLEGKNSDELPEELLGAIRFTKPDIPAAVKLSPYARPASVLINQGTVSSKRQKEWQRADKSD